MAPFEIAGLTIRELLTGAALRLTGENKHPAARISRALLDQSASVEERTIRHIQQQRSTR